MDEDALKAAVAQQPVSIAVEAVRARLCAPGRCI